MPHSLRVFNFSNQEESPWKEMMAGLHVLISDNDYLSHNLRHLSFSLRELKVNQLSLAPDFLFLLDANDHPLPNTTSPYWPLLEVLELTSIPPRLPSGTFSTALARAPSLFNPPLV